MLLRQVQPLVENDRPVTLKGSKSRIACSADREWLEVISTPWRRATLETEEHVRFSKNLSFKLTTMVLGWQREIPL